MGTGEGPSPLADGVSDGDAPSVVPSQSAAPSVDISRGKGIRAVKADKRRRLERAAIDKDLHRLCTDISDVKEIMGTFFVEHKLEAEDDQDLTLLHHLQAASAERQGIILYML